MHQTFISIIDIISFQSWMARLLFVGSHTLTKTEKVRDVIVGRASQPPNREAVNPCSVRRVVLLFYWSTLAMYTHRSTRRLL